MKKFKHFHVVRFAKIVLRICVTSMDADFHVISHVFSLLTSKYGEKTYFQQLIISYPVKLRISVIPVSVNLVKF